MVDYNDEAKKNNSNETQRNTSFKSKIITTGYIHLVYLVKLNYYKYYLTLPGIITGSNREIMITIFLECG